MLLREYVLVEQRRIETMLGLGQSLPNKFAYGVELHGEVARGPHLGIHAVGEQDVDDGLLVIGGETEAEFQSHCV